MKKLNQKMLLDLKHQIYNEIGEVLTINTQNFSINGSVMFKNKKCFISKRILLYKSITNSGLIK